jgi:anti-sigma B factor antagonist
VVCLEGELDICEVRCVREAVFPEIRESAHVVVDLSGMTYLDSSGLGVLVGGYKLAKGRDATFCIAAPTPDVVHLLTITGLDRFLPIHASVDSALDSPVPTPRVTLEG